MTSGELIRSGACKRGRKDNPPSPLVRGEDIECPPSIFLLCVFASLCEKTLSSFQHDSFLILNIMSIHVQLFLQHKDSCFSHKATKPQRILFALTPRCASVAKIFMLFMSFMVKQQFFGCGYPRCDILCSLCLILWNHREIKGSYGYS